MCGEFYIDSQFVCEFLHIFTSYFSPSLALFLCVTRKSTITCIFNIYYKISFHCYHCCCCCFNYSSQVSDDHQSNGRPHKRSSTSRPHSDLVKWQGTPIRSPLLRLPVELSALAIECFECVLRYCGDLPPDPELTEVKCVYTILMV